MAKTRKKLSKAERKHRKDDRIFNNFQKKARTWKAGKGKKRTSINL